MDSYFDFSVDNLRLDTLLRNESNAQEFFSIFSIILSMVIIRVM